jgi:endonuclease III
MPRKSEKLIKHAIEVNRRLRKAYPKAQCALIHNSPLELLIATILSAQCTDERVNQVTAYLFRKYRTCQDFVNVSPQELEQDIRPTGFFRNKTRSIQGACRMLIDDFEGKVPQTMEELLRLPGVARKTANVVLGVAFGIASGVVVDTHVSRLSQRLGLTKNERPDKIEADLTAILPRSEWINFSHRMIMHGRQICLARKPRCTICPLADICPSADIPGSPKGRRRVIASA